MASNNIITEEERELILSALGYNSEVGKLYRKKASGKMTEITFTGKQRRVKLKGKPYSASKLAWLFCYGEYPRTPVIQLNENLDDYSIENLIQASLEEEDELTADRARKLFHYDERTGKLYRKYSLGGVPAGEVTDTINSGYLRVMIDGKRLLAHRLIWLIKTGVLPDFHIDHKNRSKADNRWKNLRVVSGKENALNRGISENCIEEQLNGVQQLDDGTWFAQLSTGNKYKPEITTLGTYDTYEEAIEKFAFAKDKLN